MVPVRALFGLAALCLAACQAGPGAIPGALPVDRPGAPTAPPGAPPGTCWGREISPAVVETVTEQVLLQPPEIGSDGEIRRPAVYKTETQQRILRERREQWFQAPCPDTVTPEFVAALQRALKVRGLHRGLVTGRMDGPTRAAIRRFQQAEGLDSATLSLAAARKLGLVAYDREAAE
ncbi:peptidoglycan-binding domain-containing protein [Rhodovulum adriaticum]|uniref:Putative peptidoglycan binding protein n=1 Tax=Rhodovulum adriaticum TaxID=35804 RepID=A0A4R2NME2_RHOAD|nr:peptidoglycan-binding domain-containing protein [Rhodovulum adriaticum]MBK1636033.1 peptidoglycan-binding protein [Rhodovulum adriaticum]TCP22465.1 putative peptidoglycan binding protein [Rhodovulum adriaticum]